MKPLRVIVRLKNNRLVRLREDLGLRVCEFAERVGISASTICALENIKLTPLNPGGDGWRDVALRIAEFHGVSPEFIWPDEIRDVRARVLQLEATPSELLARQLSSPEDTYERKELKAAMVDALVPLTPAQRSVLKSIVIDEKTYDDAGKSLRLSRERVRQIGKKALATIEYKARKYDSKLKDWR